MKYSIRGILNLENEYSAIDIINDYVLWRLVTNRLKFDEEEGNYEMFSFEVWLNTIEDKTSLFNELKILVSSQNEKIDWHECTHDEEVSQPCVIVEEYRG